MEIYSCLIPWSTTCCSHSQLNISKLLKRTKYILPVSSPLGLYTPSPEPTPNIVYNQNFGCTTLMFNINIVPDATFYHLCFHCMNIKLTLYICSSVGRFLYPYSCTELEDSLIWLSKKICGWKANISNLLQKLGEGHLNHRHLWVAADPNMKSLESILASTIEVNFHILLFERKQDARNTKSTIRSNITLTTLICARRFNDFANRLPLYLWKSPWVKSNHKNLLFLFIHLYSNHSRETKSWILILWS